MSVHLRLADESCEDYLSSVGRATDGVAEIRVGDLRNLKYDLKHRPEENDARHYEVIPVATSRSEQRVKKKDMASIAVLLLEPRAPPP